jgi:hypothetical protein
MAPRIPGSSVRIDRLTVRQLPCADKRRFLTAVSDVIDETRDRPQVKLCRTLRQSQNKYHLEDAPRLNTFLKRATFSTPTVF